MSKNHQNDEKTVFFWTPQKWWIFSFRTPLTRSTVCFCSLSWMRNSSSRSFEGALPGAPTQNLCLISREIKHRFCVGAPGKAPSKLLEEEFRIQDKEQKHTVERVKGVLKEKIHHFWGVQKKTVFSSFWWFLLIFQVQDPYRKIEHIEAVISH